MHNGVLNVLWFQGFIFWCEQYDSTKIEEIEVFDNRVDVLAHADLEELDQLADCGGGVYDLGFGAGLFAEFRHHPKI